MLKAAEKIAFVRWWHDEGRHLIDGAVDVLLPFSIVIGLLIGFTHN